MLTPMITNYSLKYLYILLSQYAVTTPQSARRMLAVFDAIHGAVNKFETENQHLVDQAKKEETTINNPATTPTKRDEAKARLQETVRSMDTLGQMLAQIAPYQLLELKGFDDEEDGNCENTLSIFECALSEFRMDTKIDICGVSGRNDLRAVCDIDDFILALRDYPRFELEAAHAREIDAEQARTYEDASGFTKTPLTTAPKEEEDISKHIARLSVERVEDDRSNATANPEEEEKDRSK